MGACSQCRAFLFRGVRWAFRARALLVQGTDGACFCRSPGELPTTTTTTSPAPTLTFTATRPAPHTTTTTTTLTPPPPPPRTPFFFVPIVRAACFLPPRRHAQLLMSRRSPWRQTPRFLPQTPKRLLFRALGSLSYKPFPGESSYNCRVLIATLDLYLAGRNPFIIVPTDLGTDYLEFAWDICGSIKRV